MSNSTMVSSQPKKLFHNRNGSDELDVFEAARYFAGVTENFSGIRKNTSVEARTLSNITQPLQRMSLDVPNHRGNSIPLKAMLMEKKYKQPSSPGGKLVNFLNSIFKQTSSKKTKSNTKSTKEDEDESLGGFRRKRRSSMSHLWSDSKSSYSTSASSGLRTPPAYHVAHKPTKTTSFSYLKPPPSQITNLPIIGNLKKIETFNIKSDLTDKSTSFHNGFFEKVKIHDEKQEDIKEFKRFIEDDGADSDSSSDLFELTNCDLSGLPVYETTRVVSIKRGAPKKP